MLSTGIYTAVENVENAGTQRPHSGTFLLKLGKVVSAALVARRYAHCNAVLGQRLRGVGREGESSGGVIEFRLGPGMVVGTEVGAPVACGCCGRSTGYIANERKD
jgi:hypothetical protein